MVVVYTGDLKYYGLKSGSYQYRFYRNTPCFCPGPLHSTVMDTGYFEDYDPEKDYVNRQTEPILVVMPLRFDLFLAAIVVLKRIRDIYPLTDIDVSCHAHWGTFLPPMCRVVENLTLSNRIGKYLIEFDLTVKTHSSSLLSEQNLRTQSWESLFLNCAMLWEPPDKGIKAIRLELHKQPIAKAVVIDGVGGKVASELFPDNRLTVFNLKNQHPQIPGDIESVMEIIGDASHIYCLGDSWVAMLACALGIPVSVIVKDGEAPSLNRYRMFENVGARANTISAIYGDLENVKGKIQDRINDIFGQTKTIVNKIEWIGPTGAVLADISVVAKNAISGKRASDDFKDATEKLNIEDDDAQ